VGYPHKYEATIALEPGTSHQIWKGRAFKEDAFSVGPSQSLPSVNVFNVALKLIVFDRPFSNMSPQNSKYDVKK